MKVDVRENVKKRVLTTLLIVKWYWCQIRYYIRWL